MSIDTATTCTHCGAPVNVSNDGPCRELAWSAVCSGCYHGPGDTLGRGATPDAALWAWWEQHEEQRQIEWVLSDLFGDIARQVSEERERQRGWVATMTPLSAPLGLVYGPSSTQGGQP